MNIGFKIALTGFVIAMISLSAIAYAVKTNQDVSDGFKVVSMLGLMGGGVAMVGGLLFAIWTL
jgi:hypothetical protein